MVLCEICWEDFTSNSGVESLICGHAFHKNCLDSWFSEGSLSCPTCRKSFRVNQPHRFRLYICFERRTEEDKDLSRLCEKLEESVLVQKTVIEVQGMKQEKLLEIIENQRDEIRSLKNLRTSLEKINRENLEKLDFEIKTLKKDVSGKESLMETIENQKEEISSLKNHRQLLERKNRDNFEILESEILKLRKENAILKTMLENNCKKKCCRKFNGKEKKIINQ